MCCSTAIWQLTVLSGMGAMEGKGLGLSLQAGDASEDLRLVSTSSTSHGTRDGEDIWPCPTEPTFTTGNKEEEEEEEEEEE
ncbi:unnamed protein product, partial [Taenia asiatica]|uniref:G-patch domain-containing protein n=1 Tax=Taenia asiatica TaxID=60517 RepID=A0A0R3WHH7_TAEAS